MHIEHFTLKQHTPLIHFQADDAGATLRATEVKPKLDRFLIKKIGKENIPKNWIKREEGNEMALDYGMRFTSITKTSGETEIMPDNKEKWVFLEDVNLIIKTKDQKLLSSIKSNLKQFFVLHNFGKRQSKGFGSFTYNIDKYSYFEKELTDSNKIFYKSNNNLKSFIQNNDDFYNKRIIRDWNRLKSGKNFNGYEKSRIFEYLMEKNLRWEKRFIKKELITLIKKKELPMPLSYKTDPIDINNHNNWEDKTDEEYKFGRAMLGLAEHYEYRAKGGFSYQVKINGLKNVERFKSPLTFKVFQNNVYILLEEIPNELYDSPFSFTVIIKKDKIVQGTVKIENKLKTPTKEEFSLEEFAELYLKSIGYKKQVK